MLTTKTLQLTLVRSCALLLSGLLLTSAAAQDIELRDPDSQVTGAWQKISAATVPLRATWKNGNREVYSYRRGVRLQGTEPGTCLLVVKSLTFRKDLANSMEGGFASRVSLWVGPDGGDAADDANWKAIKPAADSMAAGMTCFLMECDDSASLPTLATELPQVDQTVALLTGAPELFGTIHPRHWDAHTVRKNKGHTPALNGGRRSGQCPRQLFFRAAAGRSAHSRFS